MKKILFVIHDLCEGGAEKVLVNLVNNMDKSQYDITVMTLFDVGVNRQFLKEDITYKSCFKHMIRGNSQLMKLLSPRRLYKWLIKDHYDIVISYLEGPSARIVSGCPDENTKKVCWIHGEQHSRKNASTGFRSYAEAKMCYEKFHKIACVSQTVLEDFSSIFEMEDDLQVIYNTNETSTIIAKANEEVEDICFDADKINICGVGRLILVKGFERLVRVHTQLIQEGYPIHTYLLGVGAEEAKLRECVVKNHIEDSFTFLGYQTNPHKYVKQCDLFVCSSYKEGFSTAATEALIVGTPVLTTLCSGMREMLGENEYGVIVENNEEALYQGLKSLLDNESKLELYTNQAQIRGKFFSTEKTVKSVQDMFDEISDRE